MRRGPIVSRPSRSWSRSRLLGAPIQSLLSALWTSPRSLIITDILLPPSLPLAPFLTASAAPSCSSQSQNRPPNSQRQSPKLKKLHRQTATPTWPSPTTRPRRSPRWTSTKLELSRCIARQRKHARSRHSPDEAQTNCDCIHKIPPLFAGPDVREELRECLALSADAASRRMLHVNALRRLNAQITTSLKDLLMRVESNRNCPDVPTLLH